MLEGLIKMTTFQSTPPCGGDRKPWTPWTTGHYFNPRPLAGATYVVFNGVPVLLISIHAPLRGRRAVLRDTLQANAISIHAPLRGRHRCRKHGRAPAYFNPRPLAGATTRTRNGQKPLRFQSTPPCGGDVSKPIAEGVYDISIHAPLRGRLYWRLPSLPGCRISIHAPLRGRPRIFGMQQNDSIFQSTPPCGGDRKTGQTGTTPRYFNPRPLAGATTTVSRMVASRTYFNPRPLAGATDEPGPQPEPAPISIHAPLRGRQCRTHGRRR